MTIEQLIKEAAIEAIKTASKSAYLEGIRDGRQEAELLVKNQNDWVLFKELPDHTGRSLSYLKNRKNEANAPKPSHIQRGTSFSIAKIDIITPLCTIYNLVHNSTHRSPHHTLAWAS